MIYATVDVDLIDHPRALGAGPAMYLWTWGMLWLRKHKSSDGFIPEGAAKTCPWGKLIENRKAFTQLSSEDSGLWERVDGGFLVRNYALKNDTKDVIESRIQASRDRQHAYRDRKRDVAVTRNVMCNADMAPGVGVGVLSASSLPKVNATPPLASLGGRGGLEGAKKGKPKARGTRCPLSGASVADVAAWCEHEGIPSPLQDPEVDNMLDWARSKGATSQDWAARWRNWRKTADERAAKNGNGRGRILQQGGGPILDGLLKKAGLR